MILKFLKNKKIKISNQNNINRGKKSYYSFAKTLNALAYHDFYLLNKYISSKKEKKIKILKKNNYCYQFKIITNKSIFYFNYNLNQYSKHKINNNSKKIISLLC